MNTRSFSNGIATMCTTYFGSQYASVNSGNPPPQVTSISPTSGNTGDSNVPITISGYNLLNSNGTMPSFNISPNTMSISIDPSNSSQQQLAGTYSITAGSSPENGLVDVITDAGYSNDTDFVVNAPDASIAVITPPTWVAGQVTPIVITGSNFGNHPTIYINPSDITYTPPTFNPDGSVSTTVSVPASETAPQASVYIVPGNVGCTGSCFTSGDPADPTAQSAPAFAAIVSKATSIPVVQTIHNSPANCPVGLAGWDRVTIRQVEDQNGHPISIQGQQIDENVTVGSPNGLNLFPQTHNALTDPQGQITDEFTFCSPACPKSISLTNFTQQVSDTWNSETADLGTYQITFSCANIRVNGNLLP